MKDMKKSKIDESMVFQILDQEIEENDKENNQEYLDMIEKIQTVLNDVEKEKEEVVSQLKDVSFRYEDLSKQFKIIKEENEKYEKDNENMMGMVDLANIEKNNFESENEKLKNELNYLKEKKEKYYNASLEQNEQQLKEISKDLEQVENERKVLNERLSSMLNAKVSSDDIQKMQSDQIKDYEQKINNLDEENDKLKKKINLYCKERTELKEKLERKEKKIEDLNSQHIYEMKKKEIETENRIKDMKNELLKETERRVTGLVDNKRSTFNHSNLADFNMEGMTDLQKKSNFNMNNQSINDMMERGSMLRPGDSNMTNLPNLRSRREFPDCSFPIEEESIENMEKNINYIEEIDQKDKEIAQLKEEIIELKENKSNSTTHSDGDCKKDEQIKKLQLDIKHLKEKQKLTIENMEEEKILLKKELGELEIDYAEVKCKFQLDITKKDTQQLKLMNKIKLLIYQVKLYEDQIDAFNKKKK